MLQVPLALRLSQSELRAAIHKHQFLVGKLKESPEDEDLQKHLKMIEKQILDLGLIQNKIVKKMREGLENNKNRKLSERRKLLVPSPSAQNSVSLHENESPKLSEKIAVSAMSALSFVTEPNVSDAESAATGDAPRLCTSPAVTPCTPAKSTTAATITPSNASSKRSPSLSPPSYCAITDRVNKSKLIQSQRRLSKGNSSPSGSEASHDSSSEIKPFDAALNRKLEFMTALGLVTRKVLCELQNRRVERKRRSTANPQFVYGNCMEQAVKRKKQGSSGMHNGDSGGIVTIDRLVAVPNSTCYVCSSIKGVLSVCWSCRRAFHWNCISDTPIPPSSEGQLHCPSCRTFSTRAETESKGVPAPAPRCDPGKLTWGNAPPPCSLLVRISTDGRWWCCQPAGTIRAEPAAVRTPLSAEKRRGCVAPTAAPPSHAFRDADPAWRLRVTTQTTTKRGLSSAQSAYASSSSSSPTLLFFICFFTLSPT